MPRKIRPKNIPEGGRPGAAMYKRMVEGGRSAELIGLLRAGLISKRPLLKKGPIVKANPARRPVASSKDVPAGAKKRYSRIKDPDADVR